MKIAVIGTRGFPNVQGGIEKHCEELYPRLVSMGCEVTVFSRAPYTGSEAYDFKGVHIVPLPCPKHKYLETVTHTFLGVLKAREIKADVLHVHAIGPALFSPLARLLGLKVVLTHHGADYNRKKWNFFAKAVLRLGEFLGISFAHKVITLSSSLVGQIHEKFGRHAAMIPNGVANHGRTDGEETLQRFKLEKGKYVLAVGRMVPEKGFDDLMESFHLFSSTEFSQLNQRKLVIVGDADHEDSFVKTLREKSRAVPNVVLTGFQSGRSLQELYSHAGLFVLPSYHEGLPMVLLEALSYGSSCLVSDIPANRELDLDEERYFKPGDIRLMSRKIQDYMDGPQSGNKDLVGISQQIAQKYDWKQIAQQTIELYELIQAPGHPESLDGYSARGCVV